MVEIKTVRILKNIKHIFLSFFLTKLFALMIDLASQLLFTEEKNAVNRCIEAILKEYDYYKKLIIRLICLTFFSAHKDCFHFQIILTK